MARFDHWRGQGRRVALIGLDGTPYTYVRALIDQGVLPNLARLTRQGSLIPMDSVLPTVSCVAWTSLVTGTNPGQHGLYGFVDRDPASYRLYVTTSRHVRRESIWDVLGRAGKRVVVVNVPATYPPRSVNGLLVSGFETPDLRKGVYPASLYERLTAWGYRIDIDAWAARASRERLLDDLHRTLEARGRTLLTLLETEPWEFFIGVLMETDRIHHFLWEPMEQHDPVYRPAFLDFYRRIDELLGRIAERLDERTVLLVMADHGFCTLRREVYVNRWLEEHGYLGFATSPAESLEQLDARSVAYSLDPGRVYLNLRGREPHGAVDPAGAERLLDELAAGLGAMRDPESGEPMVERVYRRDELYRGAATAWAPDLVLRMRDGFEPKGAVNKTTLTGRDTLNGMHTTDNAMLYSSEPLRADRAQITDIAPTILALMGVPQPAGLDGAPLA